MPSSAPTFDATTYHYPPEVLTLLVDAISRLCRYKPDVVLFFRGAGVPPPLLAEWEHRLATDRENVRKTEIARSVLRQLNERQGNTALRQQATGPCALPSLMMVRGRRWQE
jgi:hypothetical protein